MTTELSPLMSFIERAAREPEFDLNKFSELLRLQREAEQEQARRAFNAAMAAVEAEIGPVLRDRLNPGVNRKYATLEAIDAVARPVYSRNGLSLRFGCDVPPKDGWMRITCTVSHRDGYSETNYLDSPVDLSQRARTPVQAVGSTISYCRRYLIQMCLNIVLADDPDDDDGESLRRREAINREVPMPEPAGNGRDPWDLWMETLDAEATKLTPGDTEGWDKFWDRNAVKRAFAGLQGEQLARLAAIQQRHRDRLWPTPPTDEAA